MNSETLYPLLFNMSNSRGLGQTSAAVRLALYHDATLIVFNQQHAHMLKQDHPDLNVRSMNSNMVGIHEQVILDNAVQLELVRRLYEAEFKASQKNSAIITGQQ